MLVHLFIPQVEIILSAINNLFSDLPEQVPNELFELVLKREGIEIERIVSKGHVTPHGEWYDQAWDEWVLLLQGRALLRLINETEPIEMKPGDFLMIPANTRHRVEWTESKPETIWLAIHFR